jgi:hypothetical protein
MAGFLLDISGKPELTIFSHRRKIDSFEKDSISGDFDFNVLDSLGVDPYEDSSWSGLTLEKWAQQVKKNYETCENQIENTVLEQEGKTNIEEWMLPIINKRKELSTEYDFFKRLVNMIEIALKNNGTIVFVGD